jgi:hypothetical protein
MVTQNTTTKATDGEIALLTAMRINSRWNLEPQEQLLVTEPRIAQLWQAYQDSEAALRAELRAEYQRVHRERCARLGIKPFDSYKSIFRWMSYTREKLALG